MELDSYLTIISDLLILVAMRTLSLAIENSKMKNVGEVTICAPKKCFYISLSNKDWELENNTNLN